MGAETSATPVKVLGRYALHEVIAAGGMATVHFGRLLGPVGFARTVAIKRLHERLAQDPEFTAMFLDEARLAARIRHPNVVPTLDVVALQGELFLVMEYVQGESLARLFQYLRDSSCRIPIPILRTIVAGALHGLHAAHEATNERGAPLGIVHRDVSPQNILVGVDGVPRVLDFGVAKATGRTQTTRDGQLKGKLSYMAPEQLRGKDITRAVDVFAMGIVLWEGLVGRKLFKADTEAELVAMLLEGNVDPPSVHVPDIPPELDAVVVKALQSRPEDRFATAREMARAIEKMGALVPASEIGEWIEGIAGNTLAERASTIAKIEGSSSVTLKTVSDSMRPATSGVAPKAQADPGDLTLTPSSTSAVAGAPRDNRTFVLAFAGAAAALLVIGVVLIVLATSRTPRATAAVPPPVASAAPAMPPTASPTIVTADPVPVPVPTAAATAHAPPAASTSAAPAPHPPKAAPTGAPTTRPTPPAPRSNCDPPYTVDAQGNRRYKRECLR